MNIMKKIIPAIVISSIIAVSFEPVTTEAKSEKQKQYEMFNKIKMNSSIVDVAKIVYGKNYKDYLGEDIYGYDGDLLCFDQMEEFNKSYSNGKVRYYNYTFKLFREYRPEYKEFMYRMDLRFKSADGSKDLKLVDKKWEDYDVVNTHDVYNSKTIKPGMTVKQLDAIMTGKGIGDYDAIRYTDYSKVGYQEGTDKPKFYKQFKSYYYTAMNQRWDVLYHYQTQYNYKKKTYEVVYVSKFG